MLFLHRIFNVDDFPHFSVTVRRWILLPPAYSTDGLLLLDSTCVRRATKAMWTGDAANEVHLFWQQGNEIRFSCRAAHATYAFVAWTLCRGLSAVKGRPQASSLTLSLTLVISRHEVA